MDEEPKAETPLEAASNEALNGEPPQARLARLTAEGLRWRYPDGVPDRARAQADHELALIGRLNYAPYFLTVSFGWILLLLGHLSFLLSFVWILFQPRPDAVTDPTLFASTAALKSSAS